MITIAFLCFLLLLCNECTASKAKSKLVKSKDDTVQQLKVFENCSKDKIIANQLVKWDEDEFFQYYLPRTSCLTCFKKQCHDHCDSFTSPNMTVYNNLFEFGLFTFNLPTGCYFVVVINPECFLKVAITPNFEDEEINIVIYQCIDPLKNANSCAMGDIYSYTKKDVDFGRGCLFFAFAFVEEDQVHYNISFDCTYIPSTRLKEETYLQLDDNCFYDLSNEKEERFVQFTYNVNKTLVTQGVSLLLPCSSGGYLVDNKTGRFLLGDSCKSVMRNDTLMDGFEFVLKKLFKNKEDWQFPRSETEEITGNEARTPIYVKDNQWKTKVEMKPVKKELPELKNKVRKGCDYVNPKSGKPGPSPPVLPPPPPTLEPQTAPPTKKDKTTKTTKKSEQNMNSTTEITRGSYIYLSTQLMMIILLIDLGLILLF